MKYTLEFTKLAVSDIEKHKKSGDRKILMKLNKLLLELMKHPRKGIGKPEKLKQNLEGLYSRRINKKHRLVYKIKDEVVIVVVLSAYSHYGDK